MGIWGTLGRAALGAATLGGSELVKYGYDEATKDGNILGKPQTTPTAAPDANNFVLGGGPNADTANQMAADAYGTGLDHQADQNAREGAFYNQANGNFDIANAAQMRGAQQIGTSLQDKQNQLAALGGTNAAMGNVNQVGGQLQALGTKPMGDSYAEAQMRQGLDAGMAQQLSMARSGRSLGAGQANMNQAAFNNVAQAQQTNQAAAGARIQEQNAYNQFQAGALGAAGQQYGAGGALAGQAGTQSNAIRTGNENVQLQNAQLDQSQQGINNQTSGLYNQLGSAQQQLGAQANQLGEQAYQFGAGRNDSILNTQLNANMALGGANTAVSQANNAADDAAAQAKQNRIIGAVSDVAKVAAAGTVGSDERIKTNVQPLESGKPMDPSLNPNAPVRALPTIDYTPGGGFTELGHVAPGGGATAAGPPSHADVLAALRMNHVPNIAGGVSPVDVLNRVPGAGAGPSASQSALLQHMAALNPANAPRMLPQAQSYTRATSTPALLQNPNLSLVTSDAHSKTRIRELETQLKALGGNPAPQSGFQKAFAGLGLRGTEYAHNDPRAMLGKFLQGDSTMPTPKAPDTAALDAAYVAQGGAPKPAVDLTAAKPVAFDYKNPGAPGSAPGKQVGVLAQDLQNTAAAGTVHETPHGLQVDAPRLTMVNTGAISELQRKLQRLEAMGGGGYQPAPYDEGLYPKASAPGTFDKSNWGKRYGTNDEKGRGFLGVLKRPDGDESSEISIGVPINGKQTEIPSMVPTLTQAQQKKLLSLREDERMPQDIVDAATEHARKRLAAGLSPFASDDESPDNLSLDDAWARQAAGY